MIKKTQEELKNLMNISKIEVYEILHSGKQWEYKVSGGNYGWIKYNFKELRKTYFEHENWYK